MTKETYTMYKQEIDNIIKDDNTVSIFLVGSSKNIDFSSEESRINDIDIFVFVNQGENQVRIIKKIEDIELDINYFSRDGLKNLMDSKEYFFLKEMKDAVILYDKHSTASNIITLCKRKFLEGPNRISDEEKQFIKIDISSKVEKLRNKEKYNSFEYDFYSNLFLKEIIVAYFKVNNMWIPKEKKLLKSLKEEDSKLYSLIEIYYNKSSYDNLISIYNYVFKSIKNSEIIKLTY